MSVDQSKRIWAERIWLDLMETWYEYQIRDETAISGVLFNHGLRRNESLLRWPSLPWQPRESETFLPSLGIELFLHLFTRSSKPHFISSIHPLECDNWHRILSEMAPSLMELPSEVRQLIWKHVVQGVAVQPWRSPSFLCDACAEQQSRVSIQPWIFMLTSKTVYSEAIHLFHNCRELDILWTTFIRKPSRPQLLDQIHTINFKWCSECPGRYNKYEFDNTTERNETHEERILEFRNIHTLVFADFRIDLSEFEMLSPDRFTLSNLMPLTGLRFFLEAVMKARPDVQVKYNLEVRKSFGETFVRRGTCGVSTINSPPRMRWMITVRSCHPEPRQMHLGEDRLETAHSIPT